MTGWTIILRSLRFYWRTHLGVLLAVAVAGAVLTGALAVGDSVNQTLASMAQHRLGRVELAISGGDHFFRAALAEDLAKELSAPTAAAMQLSGVATLPDGSARAGNVQVMGVDADFWKLSPTGSAAGDLVAGATAADPSVVLNERLARQLGVREGDSIVLRVEKPSLLPRDAILSSDQQADMSFATSLTVAAIAGEEDFGRFSLMPNQVAPYIAYVPRDWLAAKAGFKDQANLLLIGKAPQGSGFFYCPSLAEVQTAVRKVWQLADASLELRELTKAHALELRTKRVFLEDPVSAAAKKVDPHAMGILTYFVNEIRLSGKGAEGKDASVPYSMVCGVGRLDGSDYSQKEITTLPDGSFDPRSLGMSPEELLYYPLSVVGPHVVINDWLAGDLANQAGESSQKGSSWPMGHSDIELTLTYFVPGPMRQLETRSSTFANIFVLPTGYLLDDRDLMPDIPGLADVDNCRDWKPGIDVNLKKLRPQDEKYWNEHRGTPKVFLPLADAQKMWANRFGSLTAVRFPLVEGAKEKIACELRDAIDPATVGLAVIPVGEQAAGSSSPPFDFGQLFAGFSLFLIVAALLLTGLLFVLGTQQRAIQAGTMLAIGFSPWETRWLLWGESAILAAFGATLGIAVGLGYTAAMVAALNSIWRGAVNLTIEFAYTHTTLVLGFCGIVIVSGVIMLLALWLQLRRPARVLISGGEPEAGATSGAPLKRRVLGGVSLWIGLVALLAAIGMGASVWGRRDPAAAGIFFGSGSLLLVAAICLGWALLSAVARGGGSTLSLFSLAIRNAARRRGRSLATIGLLACGSFLVISVEAFRQSGTEDVANPAGGAGGFFLIGKTSIPVFRDMNSPEGRKKLGLSDEEMRDAKVLPLRLREGAEASCLNLNHPAEAQVLGVDPGQLALRGAFTFESAMDSASLDKGWKLLDEPLPDGAVPAVADANTLEWSLGKAVGDTLDYTDDAGRPVKLRIVAAVSRSILQGSVLISQASFEKHFPSSAGYRMFLIDVPPGRQERLAKYLTDRLGDQGMELTPTATRLAELGAVENTYLSIFQLLGGLGLVLGSVALGLVVLRNMLERRRELAMLRAVGFSRGGLQWLVFVEHAALLAMGLVCGLVSAALAVLPALRGAAAIPYASLGWTLLAVLANGALWTYVATAWSIRGGLMAALRNE